MRTPTRSSHSCAVEEFKALASSGYTPLKQYGVIGNCRTAALVSLNGSIDWLCLPHFSGSAVFSALLDESRGGVFRVCPSAVIEAQHCYIDQTNVLQTTYRCEGGVLRLTDFMSIAGEEHCSHSPQAQHELVRIAECTEGSVELKCIYRPRPADARHRPALVRRGALGWAWSYGGTAAYLHSDVGFSHDEHGTLIANERLRAGERKTLMFSACENEA